MLYKCFERNINEPKGYRQNYSRIPFLSASAAWARAMATELVDAIEPNEETDPAGEMRPYFLYF